MTVKVSVFYPNTPGAKFDMDYYVVTHMPLVKNLLGEACIKWTAETGLGDDATYIAIGCLYLDCKESWDKCIAAHGAAIFDDIPNYTELKPIVQMSTIAGTA